MDLEAFCKQLGTAFAQGDADKMIAAYSYPLAISSPAGWRLEETPDDTRSSIFLRRAAAMATGMRSVDVDIGTVEIAAKGRFTMESTWRYLGRDDAILGTSRIRYYCIGMPSGPFKIDMIEFREIAFSTTPPKGWTTGRRPS